MLRSGRSQGSSLASAAAAGDHDNAEKQHRRERGAVAPPSVPPSDMAGIAINVQPAHTPPLNHHAAPVTFVGPYELSRLLGVGATGLWASARGLILHAKPLLVISVVM